MKKSLLLFAAVLFAFSTNSFAQFKLGVTPVTGINFNIHTGSDLPQSGNGFGFVLGAQADMAFNKSVGLVAGMAFYDNRYGSYSETGSTGGVQYTDDNSSSISYFQLESLFKYKLPSNFYFVFGPELGFSLSAEAESETKITTPGYTFQDGSTTRKTKATIKNTQTRFELKMGAGYEIPIADNIHLVPQLTFGYGLTNVVEDVEWKILTFQALVGVKFDVL